VEQFANPRFHLRILEQSATLVTQQ
jgi:hypothetical protein